MLSLFESLLAFTVVLIAAALGRYTIPSQSTSTCPALDAKHNGYFSYDSAYKPHHASWGSWWHPQRAVRVNSDGEKAGARTRDWNILYHLGGNGPWIEKEHDVVDGGIAVPGGCKVEQVHMMSRHAERYPTAKAGKRMKKLLEKMKKSGISFQGDLAFINDWQLFWSENSQLAQLTSTGPHSGTLGAFTTGIRLRTRYQHLIPVTSTKLWASDSPRVIDTARYVAAGLFGLNSTDKYIIEVVPEGPGYGANTLTPGDTCPAYKNDPDGWVQGIKSMHQYRATYFPAVRKRLQKDNPGIDLSDDELYAMQEMCGFEITVRGSSPWCDVFTQEEFVSFEYARDLHHYYRAGPGIKYGPTMGWLWLNATKNILLEGPKKTGPFFFSFVHDTDMAPMIAALDIMTPREHLPVTHIPEDRVWRKSPVSPMGGRIIFELLTCTSPDQPKNGEGDRFVRININDGITALPDCNDGPGASCPLGMFAARVERKGQEAGDFREMCGLDEKSADRIVFLHQ